MLVLFCVFFSCTILRFSCHEIAAPSAITEKLAANVYSFLPPYLRFDSKKKKKKNNYNETGICEWKTRKSITLSIYLRRAARDVFCVVLCLFVFSTQFFFFFVFFWFLLYVLNANSIVKFDNIKCLSSYWKY